VFAEFIVGRALGIAYGMRRDWDYVDHEYGKKTIEVKATGLAQRWRQGKKRSAPSFDIAKKIPVRWGEPDAEEGVQAVRSADCYVFCIHTDKEAATANALDLNHWKFLVISKEKLNREFGDQKSVACSVIRKHCEETDFVGLKATVDACLTGH
jgi:hypothetical protein